MPQQSRAEARRCSLRLLGRWQLLVDDEDIALGRREQRLVALLGLFGRSSRVHVAGTLWPDSTDARALASLRRAVHQAQQRCPGLLQADRLSIGLDGDIPVDVDGVLSAAAATEAPIVEGQAGVLLGQLVGEALLPDWYDDWVLPERERLEQVRVNALERIARQALESGDLELYVGAARAASDIDPLVESAGELAIRAQLGRGDLGSALLAFDRYREALRGELDVPPSRTTRELIEPALAESRVAVDALRREAPEVAPLAPPAAQQTLTIAGRSREPVVSTGRRGVDLRLLGVAALVLAAALAVAGVGPPRDGGDAGRSGDARGLGDTGGPDVTVHPQTGVLPADRGILPVQMAVRLVDAAVGRASFLVRTTAQPALVRLEVRGNVGGSIVSVVRNVLVRSPQGRRLELSGLLPGIYRWLATSSVAPAVSGRLRIPEPPVVAVGTGESDTTIEQVGATPPAGSADGSTTAASPAPQPSHDVPQPSSDVPQPHPAPQPDHTGPPKDPGTRPAPPIG